MTPAERTAKIAELRAEADRLEREGALPALTLEWCDEIWRNCPRGISTAESVKWVIEQDRARTTIKAPDAPEPTGAELVGKVCDFSDNGVDWTRGSLWTGQRGGDPRICTGFSPDTKLRYYNANCAWKYARLYREDRP